MRIDSSSLAFTATSPCVCTAKSSYKKTRVTEDKTGKKKKKKKKRTTIADTLTHTPGCTLTLSAAVVLALGSVPHNR